MNMNSAQITSNACKPCHGTCSNCEDKPIQNLSGITDNVFTGVVPEGIPFQRPPGYIAATYSKPEIEIGDPWNFYHKFWQAHGLDHLADIVAPELSVHVGRQFMIPLIVHNPTHAPINVTFSVKSPEGFKVQPVLPLSIAPYTQGYVRVSAVAPTTKLPGWQQFSVSADSGGSVIGTVHLRVELSNGWVAPQ